MLSIFLIQLFALTIVNAQIDYNFLNENNPTEILRTNLYKLDSINFPNVTHLCEQQFLNFVSSLKNKSKWAEIVFDSYGKPASGILRGNILWVGDYSECINVKETWWTGKYCSLNQPTKFGMSLNTPWKYGMCLPDSCSLDDVKNIVNFVIEIISGDFNSTNNLKAITVDVQCQETKKIEDNWAAILSIVLLSIIVTMVVFGTLYDLFKTYVSHRMNELETQALAVNLNNDNEQENLIEIKKEKKDPLIVQVLLGFSALSNSKKLFSLENPPGQLECLNGVRFLSISWVILGHTYRYLVTVADNVLDALGWFKRLGILIIANGTFSVDSFFLLSGLLTAYLFFKEIHKGKKINFGFIFKYYLHRYIRLTPPLIIIILISLNLTPYMGNGPFYPANGFEPVGCKTNWYLNLLYINNLFDPANNCIIVSWYLGNDMQFHWISPLILIPLALKKPVWKMIGMGISMALICCGIISTAVVLNTHNPFNNTLEANLDEFSPDAYNRPWCRVGPFVIGLLLGYFVFINKIIKPTKTNEPPTEKWIKNVYTKYILDKVLLMLALGTCGLMLFGPYGDFDGYELTRTQRILYQASSRTFWSLGLAYIIYACLNSKGGIINDILCWKIWIPLARLSFSAFLVHLTVLFYFRGTLEHPIHYQDLTMVFNYFSILVAAFIAAFLFTILFEIPFISLESFIFKRK